MTFRLDHDGELVIEVDDGVDYTDAMLSVPDMQRLAEWLRPPPETNAWQPIETAPKDGTRLLLAKIVGHPDHETAMWWAITGSWSLKWNKWWDGIEPCGLAGPTHWMPTRPLILAGKKPARCPSCDTDTPNHFSWCELPPEKTSEPTMAMLPNKHHPGPGCSCRECFRNWPEKTNDTNDSGRNAGSKPALGAPELCRHDDPFHCDAECDRKNAAFARWHKSHALKASGEPRGMEAAYSTEAMCARDERQGLTENGRAE